MAFKIYVFLLSRMNQSWSNNQRLWLVRSSLAHIFFIKLNNWINSKFKFEPRNIVKLLFKLWLNYYETKAWEILKQEYILGKGWKINFYILVFDSKIQILPMDSHDN